MKILIAVVLTVIVGAASGAIYLYSGVFDIAADVPHTAWVSKLLGSGREHSIAFRADGLTVPTDLADPKRISVGASEYAEMCSGCHLAPGMEENELRPGLYPAAPKLAVPFHQAGVDTRTEAARQFWVIKHGIKMSAMPAWGKTHDDDTMWSIVAFLQKLPELTAAQYAAMTADAESAHAHDGHGDSHDDGEAKPVVDQLKPAVEAHHHHHAHSN